MSFINRLMDQTTESDQKIEFNVSTVAQQVKLPLKKVESALKLLDDGNTVPFITRYRRDQTGGLDEEQIRAIKREAAIQRGLVERKQTVLKAIENQDKLTDELKDQILKATSIKQVEDAYLPFKPKRQTLATIARQQGLEPLAKDIIDCRLGEVELATRALDFVRVDRGVENVEQVIEGVKYLVAEHYSENSSLRTELRKLYWKTGKLSSQSTKPIAETKKTEKSQDKKGKSESDSSVESPEKETNTEKDTTIEKNGASTSEATNDSTAKVASTNETASNATSETAQVETPAPTEATVESSISDQSSNQPEGIPEPQESKVEVAEAKENSNSDSDSDSDSNSGSENPASKESETVESTTTSELPKESNETSKTTGPVVTKTRNRAKNPQRQKVQKTNLLLLKVQKTKKRNQKRKSPKRRNPKKKNPALFRITSTFRSLSKEFLLIEFSQLTEANEQRFSK